MALPLASSSDSLARMRRWIWGRRAFDRDAAPIYLVISILVAFLAVALEYFGFRYDRGFVRGNVIVLGTFLGFAAAARWIGFPRLASMLEAWILLIAVSALTALCAFVAAALDRPLVDAVLAAIDLRLFGFSRDLLASFAVSQPVAFRATVVVYDTLSLQPFVLLPALIAFNQRQRAWMFLLAWSLALAFCLAVSPFAPARGTPPYVLEWIDVFDGARAGSLRTLDASVLTGIITFPSFHAAGAVVLAWGTAASRFMKWPMIALNAAVAVSAVLVGGHYIIDVVAGGAAGAAAVWLAGRVYYGSPRSQRSARAIPEPARLLA